MTYDPSFARKQRLLRKKFGAVLVGLRMSRKLTEQQVAAATGLPLRILRRLENGCGNASWGELLSLTDFYDVHFEFKLTT